MKTLSVLFLGFILLLTSCKKESAITIPTTYNFSNVNYDGQTARLEMLQAMTTYMKTANTSGTTISATTLKAMFANEGNPFIEASLNISGKDIKSKTFGADVTMFEDYMEALGTLSGTTAVASAGTAGIATSGSKAYLLNENGVEYTQLIEKRLMGALSYYQISENYTRDAKIGIAVDNETVEIGKGTDMEHHWDEAFGYIGANKTLDDANYSYHAKYAGKGEDAGLETRTNLINAFLAGRAAISTKNTDRKNEEAINVRKYMDETTVTTAIHYLNGAKENLTDYAISCHELSEAYAFIISLKYNADAKITTTELAEVKAFLENSAEEPDFANITVANINSAIDKLSTVYSLDAVKATL
tara:strand:+ start:808 stop:1884 length:1077 start_codon:yes stop_codon:yes gene_type:complete